MPKISVIIPVYNVEKYLRQCLDSVCAQTFTDFEVICVDDGSTDMSPAILADYAARDSRFRVFRKEHSNAGAARNFGMTKAKGDYLAFLDSDDVFSPWMFMTLQSKAVESEADIVACEARWFRDGSPVPEFVRPNVIKWMDRTPDANWSCLPLAAGTMPWNKIIHRTLVQSNDLAFLEQASTNDLTFMVLALALSRKTFHTKEPLVGYRRRIGSIQSNKSKSPCNYIKAIEAVEAGLKSRGRWEALSSAGKGEWLRFCAHTSIWELSTQTTLRGYASFYSAIVQMGKKFRSSNLFPQSREDDPKALTRLRDISKGGFGERSRAIFEACFAPFLGNRERQTGVRAKITNRLIGLRRRLFG